MQATAEQESDEVRIALLRGVMPGTRTAVPMADLRAALTDAGLEGVKTYIASGNAVFRDPEGRARGDLEAMLERLISERIGPELDVMVRSLPEWEAMIAACPFPEDAAERPSKLLATALKGAPEPEAARAFEALAAAPDKCRVIGDTAWLVFTDAASLRAYTPAAYKRLGFSGTGRNWNTVRKLRDMAAELAA